MRQLTVKQKKLLDKVYTETKIDNWDNLPIEIINQLESINNTEILWSEVNRYLGDKKVW